MKRILILLGLLGALSCFTACPVQHYATVSWHPGGAYSATVEYRVYRSQLVASNFSVLGIEPQSITTYVDLAVVSGQTYYYRITAYDTKTGAESSPSSTVGTTIP